MKRTLEGITIIVVKDDKVETKHITKENPGNEKEQLKAYLEFKANEVMRIIEPICNAFEIYYFDYDIAPNNEETLIIENQKIACSMNSYEAIVEEVLGYIIVKKYNRYLPEELKKELYARIQRSWYKEKGKENANE